MIDPDGKILSGLAAGASLNSIASFVEAEGFHVIGKRIREVVKACEEGIEARRVMKDAEWRKMMDQILTDGED